MLTVTIIPADFAASSEYNKGSDCPLYHALTRMHPNKVIIVRAYSVSIASNLIEHDFYQIPEPWGFESPYLPNEINQLIADAKEGKQVPYVTFDLIPK
jgi:hypothetical protein